MFNTVKSYHNFDSTNKMSDRFHGSSSKPLSCSTLSLPDKICLNIDGQKNFHHESFSNETAQNVKFLPSSASLHDNHSNDNNNCLFCSDNNIDKDVSKQNIDQQENDNSIRTKLRNRYQCSFTKCIRTYVPILEWLPKYPIKSYLLADIIAGLTVSVLHIPQGIAYSMLAGLDPVHGLYVSFFPVLIYALLGTSPHISVGTFAIASIMLNNIATKMGAFNHGTNINLIMNNSTIATPAPTIIRQDSTHLGANPTCLEVLTSVCFVCGLIQIAMGVLRLGSLSLILSEHLVSAFSTSIAFHVATSQLSSIFGYKNLSLTKNGPFKLIKTWIILSKHIHEVNIYCLISSVTSIFILVLSKEFLEPRLKKHCAFPLPIDLILIITSILMSWLFKFNQEFQIEVVKTVPTGLPKATVPRFDLMADVFIDSVVLSIVCFAVSLSLAKIFANKHGLHIRPNQELLALGSANVFSSFFLAYPCSAALSRSTLQEKIGGKTQLVGIVSSTVILTVLLFFAPFLYHLPKFTLSCIVLVALKSMFLQILDVGTFWKISKLDGATWIITFLSVIILDIDYGLIVGIFSTISTILIRLAFPRMLIIGHPVSKEIYSENYNDIIEYQGVKIYRFCSPLFYLNAETFKEKIMTSLNEETPNKINRTLILDLSAISFIDKSGIDVMVEIINTLQQKQIQTRLTDCPKHIRKCLNNANFFERIKHQENSCRIYPTNQDAVIDLY